MAFLNKFFKRRKTGERNEFRKELAPRPSEAPKVDAKEPSIRFGVAPLVERAHITEKTVREGKGGKYTFVVSSGANKREVARAVESKYGVRVRMVHVVSMPAKMRRRGRQIGWKSGFKKAVVTLEKGATLDLQ